MNKWFRILLFVLVGYLWSCAGQSSEDMAMTEAAKEDMSYEEFEMAAEEYAEAEEEAVEEAIEEKSEMELTNEQRSAYMQRAKEKFVDLIDYVNIISNKNLEPEFCEQAIELATELFSSDSVLIYDSLSVEQYLRNIYESEKRTKIQINELELHQAMESDSLGTYKGLLKVDMEMVENGVKTRMSRLVNVQLIEEEKDFGDHKERVQEVRLGKIY